MITAQSAKAFTDQWINAWNSHDIEDILGHYSDDIVFSSPLISQLNFNKEGIISNKQQLRQYFEKGLKTYPDLCFRLQNYLWGVNTIVINYTSVGGRMAAEVFELNTQGKVIKVYCHYST